MNLEIIQRKYPAMINQGEEGTGGGGGAVIPLTNQGGQRGLSIEQLF